MKTSFKLLLAAGVLSVAGAVVIVPASAQPTHFSFRVGDVAMGFNDGYYDSSHQWHRWHNRREHNWYRSNYAQSYHGSRHRSWDRDSDHDGTPNWRDSRPNNPYRN